MRDERFFDGEHVNKSYFSSELPTGRGFADVVFLPLPSVNKPALVVELKYDKDNKNKPHSCIIEKAEKL